MQKQWDYSSCLTCSDFFNSKALQIRLLEEVAPHSFHGQIAQGMDAVAARCALLHVCVQWEDSLTWLSAVSSKRMRVALVVYQLRLCTGGKQRTQCVVWVLKTP